MTKCFVDTVCWIALLNQDDQIHEDVKREYEFYMKSGHRFVTTTTVLNETANALSGPNFRMAVVDFYKRLQMSTRVKIVFVNKRLWSSSWLLYEQRSDKAWSLADCISMVVMQERGLQEVLTTDKHFRQAGFQILL
ncbi:MAG: PIN domain-containing protein [Methanophagales archaeon]|nr:PIN domain-containing protein [Methanophagales archaeon]